MKIKTLLIALVALLVAGQTSQAKTLRLLYWNIQNGMWSDQANNYDNFVHFVDSLKPDVCVWCEAKSIYINGTDKKYKFGAEEEYLPANWDLLAARYGHKYVCLSAVRDNYPQVITSKYPIKMVKRIMGQRPEIIVAHGSSWQQIEVCGKTLNIVTLHTWPQAYGFNVPKAEREKSKAEHGGDKFRATEMQFICESTVLSVPGYENQYWMMLGDFNSRSRQDAATYTEIPADSPAYLTHDYILNNTKYVDLIYQWNGGKFTRSTGGKSRIDYIYVTQPLYDKVKHAEIIDNGTTSPVRDVNVSNFYHPSDHLPILVDFKF